MMSRQSVFFNDFWGMLGWSRHMPGSVLGPKEAAGLALTLLSLEEASI